MKNLLLMIFLFVGVLFAHAQTVQQTDISTLDHAVYFQPVTALSGRTVEVRLRLKSQMATGGFQTELVLPEGVTVKSCVALRPGDAMPIDAYKVGNGNYRILFVFKANNRPEANSDAELVSMTLNIANDVEAGDYPVVLTSTEISSALGEAGTAKRPDDVNCLLQIRDFIPGDVNKDGVVNRHDIDCVAMIVAGGSTSGLSLEAADVNGDGYVSLSDVFDIINIVNEMQQEQDFILGDVNKDGVVNKHDIDCAAIIVAGSSTSGLSVQAADVNGDGAVSISDVIDIINMVIERDE